MGQGSDERPYGGITGRNGCAPRFDGSILTCLSSGGCFCKSLLRVGPSRMLREPFKPSSLSFNLVGILEPIAIFQILLIGGDHANLVLLVIRRIVVA